MSPVRPLAMVSETSPPGAAENHQRHALAGDHRADCHRQRLEPEPDHQPAIEQPHRGSDQHHCDERAEPAEDADARRRHDDIGDGDDTDGGEIELPGEHHQRQPGRSDCQHNGVVKQVGNGENRGRTRLADRVNEIHHQVDQYGDRRPPSGAQSRGERHHCGAPAIGCACAAWPEASDSTSSCDSAPPLTSAGDTVAVKHQAAIAKMHQLVEFGGVE